jgi:hypothetical protein
VLPVDLELALTWYGAATPAAPEARVSATRDAFQARLDGLLRELLRAGWSPDEAVLLVAVLGEIGNNSFDHNLGQWPDAPGCWLGSEADVETALFWVVDRGVGMLATLGRVDPSLTTPRHAIDAAFSRTLSGRAPERRGNGLKFVRSVVNGHASRGITCRSGGAAARFGAEFGVLAEVDRALSGLHTPGVAAVVAWRAR